MTLAAEAPHGVLQVHLPHSDRVFRSSADGASFALGGELRRLFVEIQSAASNLEVSNSCTSFQNPITISFRKMARPAKITNLGQGLIKNVIVVGAGPSGMLLAIMLAKAGITVQVVEATKEVSDNPRAAHYAPSAVWDFDRAGVLDEVNAQGFHPDAVCWRWPDGTFISGISMGAAGKVEHPMVVLPLDRLIKLFYEHLIKLPGAEVLLGHRVLSIDQDDNEARIVVATDAGEKTLTADYIVGADGASSKIRRCLFGSEYPGETLKEQIIATNVCTAQYRYTTFSDMLTGATGVLRLP